MQPFQPHFLFIFLRIEHHVDVLTVHINQPLSGNIVISFPTITLLGCLNHRKYLVYLYYSL